MMDDDDGHAMPHGTAAGSANEKLAAVSELRFLNGQWAELEMDLLTYGTSSQPTSAASEGAEATAAAQAGKTALELYQECAASEEEHLLSSKKRSSHYDGQRGGKDPYLALASLCDKLLSQWDSSNYGNAAKRRSHDGHESAGDNTFKWWKKGLKW